MDLAAESTHQRAVSSATNQSYHRIHRTASGSGVGPAPPAGGLFGFKPSRFISPTRCTYFADWAKRSKATNGASTGAVVGAPQRGLASVRPCRHAGKNASRLQASRCTRTFGMSVPHMDLLGPVPRNHSPVQLVTTPKTQRAAAKAMAIGGRTGIAPRLLGMMSSWLRRRFRHRGSPWPESMSHHELESGTASSESCDPRLTE